MSTFTNTEELDEMLHSAVCKGKNVLLIADQPAHPPRLKNAFDIHFSESIISRHATSVFSIFS